jgi:DeoR/GlpR family transcriptional regulator of sugar metabolism
METLTVSGTATVDDLSARFGVSRMTIHRDLDQLEQDGLLRKVRGGATMRSSARFESDFRYRRTLEAAEKGRIAAAAAAWVEPGSTVIIDDGSTAACLSPHLAALRPLTVITNNLAVIQDMTAVPGTTLIVPGGQYSRTFHGFFGLVAEEALRSLRADVALLSTSSVMGLSAFHQEQEAVQAKRLMMAAAARRYLLVDHAKFGRTALHFLTELKAFDGIVTGRDPGAEVRAAFETAGLSLTIAEH